MKSEPNRQLLFSNRLWRMLAGAVLLAASLVAPHTGALTPPPLEAPFTQITNSVVTTDSGMWTTPAWGDFDNDGWLDLFVANFEPAGRHGLFRNNQNGSFTKALTGPVATEPSAQAFGAAWADFDNDGWLDLLVSSYAVSVPSVLYRNVGGVFSRTTAPEIGVLATDASSSHGVSWADFDQDGRLDLFIANGSTASGQRDFLYAQEVGGRFVRMTNAITSPVLPSGRGAWVDYDNDGDLDLFVTHRAPPDVTSALNALFRNEGERRFTNVTSVARLTDRNSVGAAWGDYDNDGDMDLLAVNLNTEGPVVSNWFYRNNGDGTFTRITQGPIAEDRDHFVSASWVDYDNDGWLDLFVAVLGPRSAGQPGVGHRLYHNQGDGTFLPVTSGSFVAASGKPSSAAAWGDYDNDGFLDAFVTYGAIYSSQTNALFRNNTNSNSWIKVKCVGTDSNRSALGAKVRIRATIAGVERWQVRQIGCDQDWVVGNSLDVVLGLGDASQVDLLRIEWPSGRVQEFQNLNVKQSLTVVERTGLAIASGPEGEAEITVRGPRQQRYWLEASSDLMAWASVASLAVTNADGTASFKAPRGLEPARRFFRARVAD